MPIDTFLPADLYAGTLVTRIWNSVGIAGPSVAVIRADGVYDLSAQVLTMSSLLEAEQAAALVKAYAGTRVGSLEDLLANSDEAVRDLSKPFFLSPCDLQVIKAAGVTFAASMIERVIEERPAATPAAPRLSAARCWGRLAATSPASNPARPRRCN
jgi:fumarylacetoacetate (FAA) hydrolase family protein